MIQLNKNNLDYEICNCRNKRWQFWIKTGKYYDLIESLQN
jgi:hypothetical protein